MIIQSKNKIKLVYKYQFQLISYIISTEILYVKEMSQQIDYEKPERHFEARYKYLADFSKQQRSPNLRKHYNDSFAKRSNSHGGRSSCRKSNERISSYKKSQESLKVASRQFSPPCKSFNPRRQITHEEFSPYDERVDKEEQRLNKELLEENASLRTQLMQAGQTIDSLKLEVAKKENEIMQIKQMSQNDLRYFQRLVSEMTNEIQIVLTKNRILENQLVVVKAKLQQQVRRQEQHMRFDEERRRLEDFRRKEEARRHGQIRRLEAAEDQRRNTPQPATKRSVGKLVVRPIGNNQQQSLGTSKIKIEEDSEQLNQSNIENTRGHENRNPSEPENKKSQEFIGSIKSMQIKIAGQQSTSLKDLWKWLKGIGHTHSCLKRWKAKAAEASTYYTSEKLKDLIREACGYIQ